MKPRVSVVQYLNTVPLVWGMLHGEQKGKFALSPATPARCADAIRSGDADVGIIPAVEVQRIPDLEVVDGLSISSNGPVRSVLLLSNKPVEQIRTVAMDESSRTSVALVNILLRKFYGLSISAAPAQPDARAMLARADAALIIGDPALAFHDPDIHTYDLAAEWRKFTGLPFVFAVWAGSAKAKLGRWTEDFHASLTFGRSHMDDIARTYAPLHHMTEDQVGVYLTQNINYNLGEENIAGLRLFFRLAHELGLTPDAKELRFASRQSSAPGR